MPQITPTDTKGYKVSKILAVVEQTAGIIPASPICVEYLAEDFSLEESQNSEVISLLGNWDAGKQAFGTTSISGSSGLVLSSENAAFLMNTAVGNRLTTADATTAVWTASQVQSEGDIVNHSDGKHSLICVQAGETFTTEPILEQNPKDDQNAKIVDGGVKWLAQPKYKKDTFAISEFIKTFTVEVEYTTPTGEYFYQRLSNCYMAGFPMSMSGGTISAKAAMSFKGVEFIESTSVGWDENLSAKVGAVVCPQDKDFYDYESFKFKIDGVSDCAESVELSLAREATIKDLLDGCKDINLATPTISGNINRVFSTQLKADVASHLEFEATAEFIKQNGTQMILTYHQVVPSNGKITASTEEKAYLSNDLNAHSVTGQVSITVEVIYPSYVDTTGSLQDPLA